MFKDSVFSLIILNYDVNSKKLYKYKFFPVINIHRNKLFSEKEIEKFPCIVSCFMNIITLMTLMNIRSLNI